MGLGDDLKSTVNQILREQWEPREGRIVPDADDLKLGKDAVRLDATVLYADLAKSTALVDDHHWWFSAEIYKSYLHCAAKIIRSQDGSITSYDGDRIMAVFHGGSKNTSAVRAALKINYACEKIINPAIKERYPNGDYRLQQTVGIDTSELHVARTGIRGSNDLVWIGRAANYAAKLSDLDPSQPTRITKAVYDNIGDEAKFDDDHRNMWTRGAWNSFNGSTIYSSSHWWGI